MNIRHLVMICEVAATKSLTKAAENLYVTQSALSHQLKEIEQFFGTPIFIRQKKEMLLTREGEIILLSGKRIINEIECTSKLIHQMKEEGAGEIRVSTECYTSYPWLSSFLADFNKAYPKVDVKIISEATRCVTHSMLDNTIDIGIFEDNSHKQIHYTPLFQDEFFVIVANDHHWSTKKVIHKEELCQEPYIMYNIPLEESSLFNMLFTDTKPKKIQKIMLTEAIMEMVKAGLGYAVMPNWIIYKAVKAGEFKAIKIGRSGLKRNWYGGILKNRQAPPYMHDFINRLSKHMKQTNNESILKNISLS